MRRAKNSLIGSIFYLNWMCVICFSMSIVFPAIEAIIQVIGNNDIAYNWERKNLQTTITLASIGYLLGKYSMYFLLYLRLYFILKKSAYCYSDGTYRCLKALIFAEIFFSLLALCFFIAADDGPLYTIGQILALTYLLLDFTIPILLYQAAHS